MFYSLWKVMPVVALGVSTLALEAKPFQSDSQSDRDRDGKDREEYWEEKCCFSCRERPCRKIACFCVEEEQDPCRPGWFTPLRECVSCWGDSIKVDFLYWGAQNNGFAYAINQASITSGSVAHITEHWSPGVRISLGREFSYDLWDLTASWTWYKNTMSGSQTQTAVVNTSGIRPSLPLAAGFYGSATARWRVLHNVIDVDLGKEYRLSKAFALRPHWGLRAAWIHQQFRTDFSAAAGNIPAVGYNAKQNWFGLGPRAGVCSDWQFGWGFSMVGRASVSALYGRQKVVSDAVGPFTGANLPSRLSERLHQFSPSLQTFLGLQWGMCFNEGKASFAIQAGWENNYWWNQYLIHSLPVTAVTSIKMNHPLELEGLTLNVQFDF